MVKLSVLEDIRSNMVKSAIKKAYFFFPFLLQFMSLGRGGSGEMEE